MPVPAGGGGVPRLIASRRRRRCAARRRATLSRQRRNRGRCRRPRSSTRRSRASAGWSRDRRRRGGACSSGIVPQGKGRSEEHTSELQSLMRLSYAVFCLKKKKVTYPSYTIHFIIATRISLVY